MTNDNIIHAEGVLRNSSALLLNALLACSGGTAVITGKPQLRQIGTSVNNFNV